MFEAETQGIKRYFSIFPYGVLVVLLVEHILVHPPS